MRNILSKFKNIHFLWLVGVICFLTFYVPVRLFTNYDAYVPEWILPLFIFGTMVPLWIHEFLWRTASFASDSYMIFHNLHFENKKWKNQTCNPFYFLRNYFLWLLTRVMFWIATLFLILSLFFAFSVNYNDYDFHPFFVFYLINTFWWIGIIKDFIVFKNEAEDGNINYRLFKD